MGGRGSGRVPEGSKGLPSGQGRKKTTAVAVVGSGEPVMPRDMPDRVQECWFRLIDATAGIAHEQDTEMLVEASYLLYQREQLRNEICYDPTNIDLTKLNLTIGRSLFVILSHFGLTPRSRQLLLIPKQEEEQDEFEKLMAE